MGRRTYVLETPWGRVIEGAKGAKKVQVHVGAKGLVVYSFSGIVGYYSTILLLPCVSI